MSAQSAEETWVVAPGYERVAEAFVQNLQDRGDRGAAFAAYVDGRLVVDVWGGVARRDPPQPWRRDSLACIFSGSKGLVATCLLLMLERGLLDLDEPVARYWPEFGQHGKGDITVRHLASHQAGLPGVTTPVTLEHAVDGRLMARLLAAQPALHPPGDRLYYHAITFGWLCGELIRRVDGRSLGRVFRDEVARPLGLDAWIGLPVEHDGRVVEAMRGAGFGEQPRDRHTTPERESVAWSIWANPPRFATDALPANMRSWRAAEVPASNAIATARALARLYGCLAIGGSLDGVRLLAPETIELGTTCIVRAFEPFLDIPVGYGVGFALQTEMARFGPEPVAFGHPGAGGSVHGAWPARRTGFSYITADLRELGTSDTRAAALMTALHEAVPSPAAERGAA
jgi:CubicO group peptidase (beta-lactamase class C family)